MKTSYHIIIYTFLSIVIVLLFFKTNYPSLLLYNIGKINENQDVNYLANEDYHEQIAFYNLYNSQRKIVMLGTSLTYRVNWNDLIGRNDISNQGIGRDITEGFLNRVCYVFKVNPEICFIEGGINDIFMKINLDTITNNVNKIIIECLKNKVTPVLILGIYLSDNHPKFKKINIEIDTLNNKLKKLASLYKIEFIDLNLIMGINKQLDSRFTTRDGLHLSPAGYKIWGTEISKTLGRFGK